MALIDERNKIFFVWRFESEVCSFCEIRTEWQPTLSDGCLALFTVESNRNLSLFLIAVFRFHWNLVLRRGVSISCDKSVKDIFLQFFTLYIYLKVYSRGVKMGFWRRKLGGLLIFHLVVLCCMEMRIAGGQSNPQQRRYWSYYQRDGDVSPQTRDNTHLLRG